MTPTRSLPLNTNKPVFKIFGKRTVDSVYACSPSPRGHDALCLVGTGDGLRAIDIETVTRLTDVNVRYFIPPPANHNDRVHIPIDGDDIRCFPPNGLFMHRQRHLGTVTSSQRRPERSQPSLITCVDFVNNHPRLAVAGGRNPVPWIVDLREPSWRPFGTNANALGNSPNAVAHIRSVGEYHVVAAGLWDAMVMYDLRYLKTPRSSSGRTSLVDRKRAGSPAAEPLFRYSDYYNHGRLMGIGFDVDTNLGIVAAAEDHKSTASGLQGGLGLFSLWNGERLHAPGLWRVQHHPSDIDRVYRPTPDNVNQRLSLGQSISMEETEEARAPFTVVGDSDVHPDTRVTRGGYKHTRPHIAALSFASLPHEGTSLFVGVDARVQKYSIRRGREDVFYGEDEEDKRTT
ncbi:hypothetical protein SPBR_01799 [Sporothrix brasiliensis 5110]|uniref:Myocyte-specific enhancer factor 2d n=1 Tax=Sporothrix brasiliensis 5110 TaxID=1398154 RepID=A0A0C2IRA5_9PEZI|nr:uncharacterized protein SPBR_01799 [Sporothrix brasiliensis 5110]KIH91551.1 hypothetical protein SPBR_01799 [Sporothrix brasiliensis 5110]